MISALSKEKLIRYTLAVLLLLLALNAFGGGIYGLSGAKNVPVQWLNGSPFKSYRIPGIFLFIAIGGSALIASVLILTKHRNALKITYGCFFILTGWLIAQIAIIGYVSWMQPVTAAAGIVIFLLTWQLSRYEQ